MLLTLNTNNMNENYDNPLVNPDALGQDHPATYFLLSFMLIISILQIVNKFTFANDWEKFHDFETVPGKMIVFLRLVFAIVFCVTIQKQISYLQGNAKKFLKKLLIFGGIWFIAFPIVVFIATIESHYVKHRIVCIGTEILQTLCLILLSREFMSNSSSYAKASGCKLYYYYY